MKGQHRLRGVFIQTVYGIALIGCMCSLAAGCRGPQLSARNASSPHDMAYRDAALRQPASSTTSRTSRSSFAGQGRARNAQPLRVIDLAFDVIRIDLPADTIHHSLKAWNHVDEMRIGAETSAQLARNGVRVGVATEDAWTALRVIFDACDARWEQQQMIGHRGLPVAIEVGVIDSSEPMFFYDSRHRLQGKTFSAGKKLINLAYGYRPELGGVVDLQISLEIRHDRGVMAWEKRGGVIREVPAFDRKVFHELDVLAALNPGEFLVIGPSAEAAGTFLIGSRFFTRDGGGSPYEMMFFIAPKPYETRAGNARVGG